jgi:hypothetical protein
MAHAIMTIIANDLETAKSDLQRFINEPEINPEYIYYNEFGFYDYDYNNWENKNFEEVYNHKESFLSWGVMFKGIPYFCEIWPELDEIQYDESGRAIWEKNDEWQELSEQIVETIKTSSNSQIYNFYQIEIHL